MMAHSGSPIDKHRRVDQRNLNFAQLPDYLLADVALFLPKPSQALFAAAMTEQHQQSPMSKAILSSSKQWNALDFGDIERELAARLSDDDIAAVLLCIDAAKYLKILKLTGCVNIVGRGLEPLRGSTVLEQIDLSLVGQHELPDSVREMKLSEFAVVPVLQSIIDAEDIGPARQLTQLASSLDDFDPLDSKLWHDIGKQRRLWEDWGNPVQTGAALKYIQLPKRWRTDCSPLLRGFLKRRVQFLENQDATCSGCYILLNQPDRTHRFTMHEEGDCFGREEITCYNCLKHFCQCHCLEEINHCDRCEKSFCKDCVEIKYCESCPESKCAVCNGCGGVSECSSCDVDTCRDCFYTYPCCNRTQCTGCLFFNKCAGDNCNRVVCNDCEGEDVGWCDYCEAALCHPCRLAECSSGEDTCPCCKSMVDCESRWPGWQRQMMERLGVHSFDERLAERGT